MRNRTEAEPGLVYFSLFLYVYAYAVSTYVLHASACTFFPCWHIQYVVREEPLGKIPRSKANPEDSWTIPSTWWSWLFIFRLGRETIGNKDGLGNPIHLDLPILGWALTKFANFALRAPGAPGDALTHSVSPYATHRISKIITQDTSTKFQHQWIWF